MDVEVALGCTHPACVFIAVNKAGLTNHTCQKHMLPLKSMISSANNFFFIKRVFITPKNIATRDHMQHNFLASTPITCGKWSAYSI